MPTTQSRRNHAMSWRKKITENTEEVEWNVKNWSGVSWKFAWHEHWTARQPLPNSFRIDILFYRLHCSRHRTAQCKCLSFSENFLRELFLFRLAMHTAFSVRLSAGWKHNLLAQHSFSAYESSRKLCAVILLNNKINSHIRWRQHINLLLCCCSCRLSSFVVSHYLCTQAFVEPVFCGLYDVRHCGQVLPKKKRRQAKKKNSHRMHRSSKSH